METMEATTTEWTIDLEMALANGLRRMKDMEKQAVEQQEEDRKNCAKAWLEYGQMIRARLPAVLQPMMTYVEDLQYMPDLHREYDSVVIEGGKYALAPIAVNLYRKSLKVPFDVDSYRVFGIIEAFTDHQLMFCDSGAKLWLVEPVTYCDLELALAGANQHYLKRIELEKKSRKSEPEYLPADEPQSNDIVDQALIASVRGIVRDEMFKPPHA